MSQTLRSSMTGGFYFGCTVLYWGICQYERGMVMKPTASCGGAERTSSLYGEHEEMFVHTLHHLRHDWMNEIQVLYGYLKMEKYDKLHDYMGSLKEKLIQESLFFRALPSPLVVYVQSFRSRCRLVRLEVEAEPELELSLKRGMRVEEARIVTGAIVTILETFADLPDALSDGEPGSLLLRLSVSGHMLAIGFEYTGSCDSSALERQWRQWLESAEASLFESEIAADEEGIVLDLYMPLNDRGVLDVFGQS